MIQNLIVEIRLILWPSYLHNGISFTDKTASLYWIGARALMSGASNSIVAVLGVRVFILRGQVAHVLLIFGMHIHMVDQLILFKEC